MEDYIPVSFLNDFIYSPESIYLHLAYQDFDTSLYHDTPQVKGRLNHSNIDSQSFSNSKDWLQGTMFYCSHLRLCGRIDLFNIKSGILIERKTKIKTIFPGYRFQLYAQMLGLQELGYCVESLQIYSLEDNKKYPVAKPTKDDWQDLENLVKQIRNYNPLQELEQKNFDTKSQISIYKNLTF